MNASLLLEDGTLLQGTAFGSETPAMGELVFNTGMTGYQEILTDPSYAGQVVVMTYPLMGNYGINLEDNQSKRIQARGLIIKELANAPSHWKMQHELSAFLKHHGIFGLAGVDTRMLVKKIRNQGAMNCRLTPGLITPADQAALAAFEFPKDVVAQVSTPQPYIIAGSGPKIGLVDLGVKTGILTQLKALDCEIHMFPWDTPAQTLLATPLDAILLSNGPGDPKAATVTIETTQQLLGTIPLFGICLGFQILALALGADTYKLKFGHRGSNHPVQDVQTQRVTITSQNHGYAVYPESLPPDVTITHLNLNDKTLAGFASPKLNVQAVQFHPEAGPGPTDTRYLFQHWIDSLKKEPCYA